MEILKILILLCYLIIAVLILAFNWLYLARTLRANKHIGLYIPSYIKILVNTSTLLAIIMAIVVVIVLLFDRF